MSAVYAELVALAERESDLVARGDWAGAAALSAERARRSLALGAPPASAREHLDRLAALQRRLSVDYSSALAHTGRALRALARGGTAVRGYRAAAAAGSLGARVDGRG